MNVLNRSMSLAYIPDWWNADGFEISIESTGRSLNFQILETRFSIVRYSSDTGDNACWSLQWHKKMVHGVVTGNIQTTTATLRQAFRLDDEPRPSMVAGAPCTCMQAGVFFRFDGFLNIPAPGWPLPCDPNVSIFVTDEISNAVREYIGE